LKPFDRPAPAPPPVDRARLRELVEELHAAASRGESIHAHPAVYAIDALTGGSVMAGYFVVAELASPDGPPPVEAMVTHIMRHAARWASDAARTRAAT
jgi:hypothetical protein